jgi:tRNA pseudouridine55 synthase
VDYHTLRCTGHGGTLDPLATGVLVIGVGSGTKQLQNYLQGSKKYRATAELGYETTTLDSEGPVTRREPADHVTELDQVRAVVPQFVGKIQQVPPLYSALRKDGVKLYEKARKGATVDDVEIEAREVEIHRIEVLSELGADPDAPPMAAESGTSRLPKFDLMVECGGGTYIRSLVRDIGYKLGTCATTTYLERTKQGPFTVAESLPKDLWSADSIYAAIDNFNRQQHASNNNPSTENT